MAVWPLVLTAWCTLVAPTLGPPQSLQCEARVDPLGIDAAAPRLSWRLVAADPAARGLSQAAWQVLVASRPALVAVGRADLWDSGRVAGTESRQAEYGGKPLLAAQQVWWRVRVWDAGGAPSPWSAPATWTMGLLQPADWSGRWIGSAATPPPASLLLRREFVVRPGLQRALLFACGLGQHELRLNGQVVGDSLLAPGWTNYKRTCLYETFDVTRQVRAGANALGLMLGNGMYNVTGGRYLKFRGSFGPQQAVAQLRLEYADGTRSVVATDPTWRATAGPITFSCTYGGEDWDARRDPAGWDAPGFDDTAWPAAVEVAGPGGQLAGSSHAAPPITVFRTQRAVSVKEVKPGVRVYDLGSNGALLPRVVLRGPAGATLRLTPGELLNPDGTVSQRSSGGPAWYSYTCGGGAREVWAPRFTYYGSRWYQLEGDLDNVAIDTVEGRFVCSSAAAVGHFACSNELFNRTAGLIEAAIRSNMQSLFTDCPHREKLGWLEQIHLNGASLHFGFDLATLLTKVTEDMAEAQLPNGLVPDIAPEYTVFGGGFRDSPEWGSAYVLVPWQLYRWYGDRRLLARHFEGMLRYVDYLATTAHDGIVSHGLGDWYDLGPKPPGQAQLTPTALTATAFTYLDLDVLAQAATVLGRTAQAETLARRRDATGEAFRRAFWHADSGNFATGSQCANALPLVLGLVPAGERARVAANLVQDVERHGPGLTAGDVGYRYLLRALADAGRSDVVYAMNQRDDRPGYGYMLKHGATALTEAWDAGGASSQNHFMLGHIQEWFYHDLVGLQPASDAVAWDKVVVRPAPVGDLTWAEASFRSPRGPLALRWERGAGQLRLTLTLPPGCRAEVHLPTVDAGKVTEGGRAVRDVAGLHVLPATDGEWRGECGSGRYLFSAPTAP